MDWEIWGFVGGCAAFLVLAMLGSLNFAWISFPGTLSLVIYLLGTALIMGFYFVGKKVKIPSLPLLWGTLMWAVLCLYFYPQYGPLGILAAYLLVAAFLAIVERRPGERLVALGIGTLLVNFYYNGVPLLEPSTRGAFTALGALGMLLLILGINILADKKDRKVWWFFGVGLVLAALTGYRSTILFLGISTLITVSFWKEIEWKRLVLYGIALLVIVIVIGQINAFVGEENPYLLVTRRAGFTYERYDQIVNTLSPVPGLWFAPEPRYVIGEITLGEHNLINAGIFGFLWLDGGLLEVILGSVLIGLALGQIRRDRDVIRPFYGMIWIYILVAIDSGFDIIYLSGFLGALFAISWKRKYLTC